MDRPRYRLADKAEPSRQHRLSEAESTERISRDRLEIAHQSRVVALQRQRELAPGVAMTVHVGNQEQAAVDIVLPWYVDHVALRRIDRPFRHQNIELCSRVGDDLVILAEHVD